MEFLKTMQLVLSLLPTLIDTIKAIEAAIPGTGRGEAKLAAVRGILESAYNVAPQAGVAFATVWPAIQGSVSAVVALMNATGMFKKA